MRRQETAELRGGGGDWIQGDPGRQIIIDSYGKLSILKVVSGVVSGAWLTPTKSEHCLYEVSCVQICIKISFALWPSKFGYKWGTGSRSAIRECISECTIESIE